jgi:hypothetical protein
MMAAVLEWNERLREVLDVTTLFAFTTRHPDLNNIATLMQAADGHIAITNCQDNLQGEFQGVWLLEQRHLLALAFTRHPLNFETTTDLILKKPWLFLTYLKTYEA